MQAKSCLTLKNYIIKTMNFSVNPDFKFGENKIININPEFKREITKIDDNTAAVNLFFRISEEETDMPFYMFVDIEGIFHLENWEQPEYLRLMKSNTIAILFPYLRTLVSTMTANANISPYVLPVMNIAALFDQNSEEEKG